MTDAAWRFVAMLGGVAAAIGLYLGLSTVTVPAINMVQDCGSAFFPSAYRGAAGSLIVAECDSKRQDRKTEAAVAIIAGLMVGGYGFRASSLALSDLNLSLSPRRKDEAETQ